MSEVTPKLLTHGFVEEFLRLASMVLRQYVVRDNPAELQIFDRVSEDLVEVLGNLGRYREADEWIERLSATVTGKSARYIWLCHLRAYACWIRNQFDEAKRWSSEGVELKRGTNIDTIYDCAHSLALAQRDSGEVEVALVHFLGGTKIDDVTKPNSLDERRGGEFYGNIGRCLQFLERFDEALICLRKSATLLERSHGTNALLNQGWAAHWLGEVLTNKGLIDESYLSFRCAAVKWMLVSPTRCQAALRDAASLVEKLKDNSLPFCSNSECEAMYRNWLRV
jgi:tetratricopeptide (TPR) repeat protein